MKPTVATVLEDAFTAAAEAVLPADVATDQDNLVDLIAVTGDVYIDSDYPTD